MFKMRPPFTTLTFEVNHLLIRVINFYDNADKQSLLVLRFLHKMDKFCSRKMKNSPPPHKKKKKKKKNKIFSTNTTQNTVVSAENIFFFFFFFFFFWGGGVFPSS